MAYLRKLPLTFLEVPYSLRTLTRALAIVTASSSVLSLPNEIRIVPSEYSDGTPIALITCETSVFTESQAEPVDIHIPIKSKRCSNISPLDLRIDKFILPGTWFSEPFLIKSILDFRRTSLNASSKASSFLFTFSISSQLFFNAMDIPTIEAIFSVPARLWNS